MSAPAYASGTTVPVERSRAEIDTVLAKAGASSVGILNDSEKGIAVVAFALHGARFRIEVPLPTDADALPRARKIRGWQWRTQSAKDDWVRAERDQLTRERWRAVLLLIKSKLEIVRIGLSSFEREFLADMVLPDGRTAAETIGPYMRDLLTNGYTAPLALPEARP
jgi:hypothetical protein